ncbi:MAG: DUF4394 domain-containing protein [Phycisphaerales bacterium]|nr:MAG: DUF4394 domain-containing protein [Phycisphaerales bacterium]
MLHQIRTRQTARRTAIIALTLALGTGTAQAQTAIGVTNQGSLITWNVNTPEAIETGVALQGLGVNERLVGIDVRPATGELYALGSFSNLYRVDISSGMATLVGGFSDTLNGSSFGFDFNPTIDRIRVVSDAGQNLVLNPNDGASTVATPLFYEAGDPNEGATPNVVASAYTNNFAGATTSQLYGLDTGLNILVTQANSFGNLATVGSLGVNLTDDASFDIFEDVAYATVLDATLSQSTFWTIDLMTGEATMIGQIGGGSLVTSMAIIPAPGGFAIAALAGLAGMTRRRRI